MPLDEESGSTISLSKFVGNSKAYNSGPDHLETMSIYCHFGIVFHI